MMNKRIIAAALSVLTTLSAVPSFATDIINTGAITNKYGDILSSVTLPNPYIFYYKGLHPFNNDDFLVVDYLNDYWTNIYIPSIDITDYFVTDTVDIDSYDINTILQNSKDNQSNITDSSSSDSDSDSTEYGSIAEEMLSLVNKERAAQGLNSLSLDTTLMQMAQYKAEDMVSYGFSHDGSYGGFQELLDIFNVSYSSAGENIAMGQEDCAEVMTDWMNSDGHRANILNSSYTKLGVGYYNDGNTTYWVQEFTG
ncbi:MAG: CAP domain-containing protein [Oscillospiraceae bacterium]|nr:CAP domain-containing protein [Oscillospiraceae bacterium]